jgi:hypothetical protein
LLFSLECGANVDNLDIFGIDPLVFAQAAVATLGARGADDFVLLSVDVGDIVVIVVI